jgi:hypothetical protein
VIAWLSFLGAVAVTAIAIVRLVHVRRSRPGRRDPDWGDWPPDHMAP